MTSKPRSRRSFPDYMRQFKRLGPNQVMVASLAFVAKFQPFFPTILPDAELRISEAAGRAIIYRVK